MSRSRFIRKAERSVKSGKNLPICGNYLPQGPIFGLHIDIMGNIYGRKIKNLSCWRGEEARESVLG